MNTTIDAVPGRDETLAQRIGRYLYPIDARYEELRAPGRGWRIFQDFTAGLIVAMIAIPLAMGFAMASGLRPEQGIVGGAVAGLIGALWGGSKYQVYGPTAAFIPLIAAAVSQHGYPFLVLASLCAGVVLMAMGLGRVGRWVSLVPHSVVVGFTLGIAVVIATSQLGEVLGLKSALGYGALDKLRGAWAARGEANLYALVLALGTFAATKGLLRVSTFVPAPLIALGAGTWIASTLWADKGLTLIRDRYGRIPTDFWVLSAPAGFELDAAFLGSLAYFTTAIVFVSAVESLLCSRMADRLAGNRGTPFDPDRELWGQGLVQVVVPLLNGFPHTGALARTAANIRLGASSPLAGIFKCVLKLVLAAYMASFLEGVPMACIGGILLYVASGMVKPAEVREALAEGRAHIALTAYTAVMVVATDFMTGVGSAVAIYMVAVQASKLFGSAPARQESEAAEA